MLTHLPVDMTFVDETDRVAYYSEGPERIFPRSPAVIGREVRNCHPPKSVHVVNKILDAFKSGARDTAEFWIELGGKFIYIRYFAVRDAQGNYRGTLEVTQGLTQIRILEGQRRLLDWDLRKCLNNSAKRAKGSNVYYSAICSLNDRDHAKGQVYNTVNYLTY